MPLLINRQPAANDSWTLVNEETLSSTGGDIIVPLALLEANADSLQDRKGRVAVQINGDDNIDALLENPNQYELIAIDFPVFRDGRGFSLARLLKRAGFEGQIRATGDVAHDRLTFMERCGFNAFEISEERYSDESLAVFTEVSVRYQGAADDPRPVYHR
ncbi:DUF934 domain-containing protein [Marinobacterium jannaschii]|uniref:DUF934 domain-containing protein n=1 Tax=Marinobacterium jannaschii TaxID=64970 RepID=UPI000489A228|nr:DUF934 domain-containing protein [Marinobacterium jannaschii]